MFESKLFSELCDEAKKEEVFNGKPVHSKEEVYQEVAVLCNMSPETVRKWACEGSKGPRDKQTLERLEEIFGKEFVKRTGKYPIKKYSELTKQAILSIYSTMCDFFSCEDEEREEIWWKVMGDIEKSRLIIPSEEYEKIKKYLQDNLKDMVFDEEKAFPGLYSEEFGVCDEEGNFVVHYEKTNEFLSKYIKIVNDKEESFKEFMIKNFSEYF